jgi:hypothetical protein
MGEGVLANSDQGIWVGTRYVIPLCFCLDLAGVAIIVYVYFMVYLMIVFLLARSDVFAIRYRIHVIVTKHALSLCETRAQKGDTRTGPC